MLKQTCFFIHTKRCRLNTNDGIDSMRYQLRVILYEGSLPVYIDFSAKKRVECVPVFRIF